MKTKIKFPVIPTSRDFKRAFSKESIHQWVRQTLDYCSSYAEGGDNDDNCIPGTKKPYLPIKDSDLETLTKSIFKKLSSREIQKIANIYWEYLQQSPYDFSEDGMDEAYEEAQQQILILIYKYIPKII